MKRYMIFIISLFFCFISIVNAEGSTCTLDKKNSISSEGLKVTISYEFETDDSGTHFKYSIFNVSPNIYVRYEDLDGNSHYVFNSDTTDGVYVFYEYNITDIFRYKFDVYSHSGTGCDFKIITRTSDKPKRNQYYDLPECKFEKMKDFYYCKEWITNSFLVSDEQIIKSIKENASETSTTQVVEKGEEGDGYLTFKEIYLLSRKYLIIGLVIGIIIDVYCLYLSFRKVRENIL